jgi:hypothetical protein
MMNETTIDVYSMQTVADDKLRQQLLLSAAYLFGFRFYRCATGLRRDYNGDSLCAGRLSFCGTTQRVFWGLKGP